ncbi:alanine--tRNA ligase [Candidatus Micrarchaeota archaeon]|nr:alanine--tRNA ligase [Candidatus Micrarchaeota archaeon]
MAFSKEFLKKEFARDYSRYYEVDLFRREGFSRRTCSECGKGFWSVEERSTCGDSSHEPYSFIREKPVKISYPDFWKKFEGFWAKNGHHIAPRYPVISRWRDDLYFTIASIVDFQRIESGRVVFESPYSPLVVPQMCLRFNDIANVGVTGRHFSCFMMAGQHAFDCAKTGYWKNECIGYNFTFLQEVLGIPKEEIIYGEDVWSLPDFSSFGPCIESFSRGSELVNSVFTEFRRGHNDEIQPLEMQVIDVGWGFERLLWYYTGAPSAYDAVFPTQLEFMKKKSQMQFNEELINRYSRIASGLDVESVVSMTAEKEKIAKTLGIGLDELEKSIAPMQGLYAIADHSRALLFAINDGAIPSNTSGGYNLRVLARRAFSFIEQFGFGFSLFELMASHASELRPLFPELSENLVEVQDVIEAERHRFAASNAKAKKLAGEIVARNKPLSSAEMSTLYESQGVTPEIIERAGRDSGRKIEVPTDFYRKLTEKHGGAKKEDKPYAKSFEFLTPTKLIYYEQPTLTVLDARIIAIVGEKVALDQTVFYPEGGGQAADKGTLGGHPVQYAEKMFGVVVHHLDDASDLKVGMTVRLELDWARREALMRHHSATHVMIQTARRVLGNHAWQTGAEKDVDEAHVDITHYARLTAEQAAEIERRANEIVLAGLPIYMREMDRGEAEGKYGFRLYQGGGAIGRKLRIVEIAGYDVQACGGVHMANTSKIGLIKILGSESIQDGVVRIRYAAGMKALEHLQKQEMMVAEAATALTSSKQALASSAKKVVVEFSTERKKRELTEEQLAELFANRIVAEARKVGVSTVDAVGLSYENAVVEKIVLKVVEKNPALAAVISNSSGFVAAAAGGKSGRNATEILRLKGAKGGGSGEFARGKIGASN